MIVETEAVAGRRERCPFRARTADGLRVRRADVLYSRSEWDRVVERARVAGKKPGRYIREVSLGRLPGTRLALVRELGRCGAALTNLAATIRATGAPRDAVPIDAALAELLAVVRRVR
jgi:hypothetical protein